MSPPHSRCEKKRLDCGSRPTRFPPGIDPRLPSADCEPRSRTAESRRCGRSERRTPDDPADSSPNRDEMLHRGEGAVLLLLERAGTLMLACCSCDRVSTCLVKHGGGSPPQ